MSRQCFQRGSSSCAPVKFFELNLKLSSTIARGAARATATADATRNLR
jgi:hypothetical protein